MLLKEILFDANLLVPNSINDVLKVRWLNNIQGQLYRDFAFPNTSHAFMVEVGMNQYPIPADCSRERITSVLVGDTKYEYRTMDQGVMGNCWTIIDESLFIYPTPNQDLPAFLNYLPGPQEMQIEMQDEEPDFPQDFHEVLVYGIATRIARSLQDSSRAAELNNIFEELHDRAKRKLRPARNKTVQMNHSWR